MKTMSCVDPKIYTLRHVLFYVAMSCVAGAIIGMASVTMDWSRGTVYAVAIPVGCAINLTALRGRPFLPLKARRRAGHQA